MPSRRCTNKLKASVRVWFMLLRFRSGMAAGLGKRCDIPCPTVSSHLLTGGAWLLITGEQICDAF
jgi:hypothetical protein